MEQVERRIRTQAQRYFALHTDVPGPHGLHARCHAQCHTDHICAHLPAAHGFGEALPPIGYVRVLRVTAADDLGKPLELFARAGSNGVYWACSISVGWHLIYRMLTE